MGVPRAAHQLLWTGDALVAVGGHTTGFVLTQTAEVCRDGRWQPSAQPLYPHDGGFALPLRDGSVLLGGGSAQDFGIGGTWGLERFDPATLSFTGLGILDRPRAFASAIELQDGRIAVSGNWHAPDAIAVLDTATLGTAAAHFQSREVSVSRYSPYLFETSDGNVLALGSGLDANYQSAPCIMDRLHGEPLSLSVFDQWLPFDRLQGSGRFAIGPYSYLVPVRRPDSSAVAVLRVQDGQFSLLETDIPIPMNGPRASPLHWISLEADAHSRCAWLCGRDRDGCFCLARIDYDPVFDGGKARVSLFCTPLPVSGLPRDDWSMAVLPGGALAMAGGFSAPEGGNFVPQALSWVFHTQPPVHAGVPWWPFALAALLLGVGLGFWLLRRRRPAPVITPEQEEAGFQDVMTRLQRLMEEKELYRQPDLRVEDIALELGMSVAYVRGCIAGIYGDSFKNYVNEYRVRYVQKRLLESPDVKVSVLASEAGFSSPATFYRVFATVTGLSPTAWLESQK